MNLAKESFEQASLELYKAKGISSKAFDIFAIQESLLALKDSGSLVYDDLLSKLEALYLLVDVEKMRKIVTEQKVFLSHGLCDYFLL